MSWFVHETVSAQTNQQRYLGWVTWVKQNKDHRPLANKLKQTRHFKDKKHWTHPLTEFTLCTYSYWQNCGAKFVFSALLPTWQQMFMDPDRERVQKQPTKNMQIYTFQFDRYIESLDVLAHFFPQYLCQVLQWPWQEYLCILHCMPSGLRN